MNEDGDITVPPKRSFTVNAKVKIMGRGELLTGEAPNIEDEKLAPHLCEFVAEKDDWCEECNETIPEGGNVYFFKDGGFEPRDGTYTCRSCAMRIVNGEE